RQKRRKDLRVDVNKYLLVGPNKEHDLFFRQAQALGAAEFVTRDMRLQEAPQNVQNLTEALHILRGMVPVKQQPAGNYTSASVLAQHIVERNHSLEELREKQRILVREIDRIAVFGDFSIPELKQLEEQTHRVIQFFFAKQEKEVEAIEHPEVIYV